ncbi:MAG: hypothetical protein R3B46_09110 [Phycisphaerales bacterium]
MQILISGAVQGEDGDQGVLAVILIIDAQTNEILHRCEYLPPKDVVSPGQKIQFTGSCFIDGSYYVCTHNEILVYDQWPPVTPARKISLKGFNDLHHCFPWKGNLAVSNTGLETVDIVSLTGELLERYDLLKDEPGARKIDDSKDYRLIPDTKPHLRHGNHLFELDGELWTSQLRTMDAVCVSKPGRRIEMGAGMPHDGIVMGDKLVFTTTNNHLVMFDVDDTSRRSIYNLPEMTPELNQLGWCRGVVRHPQHPDQYFVCFSALRRSKWKEFGYWIKHGHWQPRSHMALYDLAQRKMIHHKQIGEHHGSQLFQIDLLPQERLV